MKKTKKYKKPSFWGPSLWKIIHCVAMTAPSPMHKQNQKEYKEFFKSLGNVIPCSICKNHYQEYIKNHPVNVSSRKQMVIWTLSLHNHINIMNGQKPWDLDILYAFYDS